MGAVHSRRSWEDMTCDAKRETERYFFYPRTIKKEVIQKRDTQCFIRYSDTKKRGLDFESDFLWIEDKMTSGEFD